MHVSQARGLSIATPGLSGAERARALQERLHTHLARAAKDAKSAQKLSSATRTMAFREFRCDQVRTGALRLVPLCLCASVPLLPCAPAPLCPCVAAPHNAPPPSPSPPRAQATKRLEISLYKNDFAGALASIANGAAPDRLVKGGVTALVQAVEHGNIEAAVMVAKAGASINAQVSRWVACLCV